jgi:hypothetical protein
MPYLPWYYLCISYFSCTWWVPTISVFNLAIFPCCSEGEDEQEFFDEEVYATCCPGCRSCGVMESSTIPSCLTVIVVFRDIIYVIIILYSWHLVICKHFWPYVWNNWSWVMHTMSSWFWHKNGVWQKWYQSRVNRRNDRLVRRVLSLILFSSICKSTLF